MFPVISAPEKKKKPSLPKGNNNLPAGPAVLLLWIVLVVGIWYLADSIVAGGKGSSPIVVDENGEVRLSPERQAKLDRALEELDSAEQYVLIATMDGFYPCYSCPDGSATIFLYKGEVWKYGVTRKGEKKGIPVAIMELPI